MYKNCYSTRKPATFEIALMFFLFLPSQTSIALSPCQLNQIWLTCITCIMVSLLRFVISFLCFPQRTALASTLRHIGEELYKPQVKSLVISWYQQLNSPYVLRFFLPISLYSLYALFLSALHFCAYFVYCFVLRSRIQVLFYLKEVQLVSAVEACLWYTNVWVLIKNHLFKVTKVSEEGLTPKSEKQKLEIYFHSPNIAVRILSSLIILKTLSRGEMCESYNLSQS